MEKAMLSAVDRADILEMTTEIVTAYVAGNTVAPDDVPELIERIHATLASLASESPQGSA
ncbi:MAG: MucR family transcriptional regulator [bacterium]|nr:MucR family transcriptional regulator [bacterium]